MNALLVAYTLVSFAVLCAVMAMLLWAAVADGRAATARRVDAGDASSRPAATRIAIRPPMPLNAASGDRR